jgi:hypothetical protein
LVRFGLKERENKRERLRGGGNRERKSKEGEERKNKSGKGEKLNFCLQRTLLSESLHRKIKGFST